MKTNKVSSQIHFRDLVKRTNYDLDDESLYFLLPDIPATVQAEHIFIENGGIWGDRLITFAKLSAIVNLNTPNPPNIISRTARLLLAEQTVSEIAQNLKYYKDIVNITEFADSILRIIAELKHTNTGPHILDSISKQTDSDTLSFKLGDICMIYSAYDNKLKSLNSIDDIDSLRLLIENANPSLLSSSLPQLKKLVVFGFHEFTDTQLDVLKCLDNNNIEVELYEYETGSSTDQKEIRLRSYASKIAESQSCSKHIWWLINKENVPPSNIAVVCKGSYENSLILKEEFKRVGLEYTEKAKISLKTSHIGKLIDSIISLKLSNFSKVSLFELLRNPYIIHFFGNDSEFNSFIADLELLMLKKRITGGLEKLSKCDEITNINSYSSYFNNLFVLLEKINKSFNSKKVSVLNDNLLYLLQELVFDRMKGNQFGKTESERNAVNSTLSILSELRYLVQSYSSNRRVERLVDYSSIISDLLSDKNYALTSAHEENKIKILDYLEARGTVYEYIFALGLSENIVPNTDVSDPLIKNNERYFINNITKNKIFKLNNEHIESEENLVNIVLSGSKHVFASYVSQDNKGRAVQPSYVLDGFKIVKDDIESDKKIITEHDKYKYLISRLDNAPNAYLENENRFIINGIVSEKTRDTKFAKLTENEGLVTDLEYLQSINKFSVTELETYGSCPFKYFASQILKLKYPEEIEDDPRPLDKGSVYHKLLNIIFIELSNIYGSRLDLRKVKDEQILSKLNEILESAELEKEFDWLSDFKKQLNIKSISQSVMPAFIIYEAGRIREHNNEGFFPVEYEKELSLQIDDKTVEGKADRVDLSSDKAYVIDYKLSNVKNKKFCDYNNLQLPLYLNALGSNGIGKQGAYYRSTERPGEEKGKNENSKDYEKDLEVSIEFARLYMQNIQNGIFPAAPRQKDLDFFEFPIQLTKQTGPPCSFCEYNDLCRAKGAVLRTTN